VKLVEGIENGLGNSTGGNEPLIVDPGAKQRRINHEARVQGLAEQLMIQHPSLALVDCIERAAAFAALCDERVEKLKAELTPRVVVPELSLSPGGRS